MKLSDALLLLGFEPEALPHLDAARDRYHALADVIRGKSLRAALESASYFDFDILSGLLYLWQLGAPILVRGGVK